MTPADLAARVRAAYAALGMPSWPAPRPDGADPREEEYSRVSDPERYRVVHGRARAWTQVLGALPGVLVEPLDPVVTTDGRRFARGARVTSPVPGTLPLVLLEADGGADADGAWPDALAVAVTDPVHGVDDGIPDCGCDACDQGSDALLEAIDDDVLRVVAGPFVLLEGRGWRATWYPDGGSMSGDARQPRDFDALMRSCRELAHGGDPRLPRSTAALVGRSWLDGSP